MARLFTLREAERLLPELEKSLRDAMTLKSDYEQSEKELKAAAHRVMMLGGVLVDRDRIARQRETFQSSGTRLKTTLEGILAHGCLVKDLDLGLIDFPTLLHGKEVYLCWKYGEKTIDFWHGVEEGFGGRKPINQEFLDQHSSELPN